MSTNLSKRDFDLLQLFKAAFSGQPKDARILLRKISRRKNEFSGDFLNEINELLNSMPSGTSPLRKTAEKPIPVDLDSRFHLLKVEDPPVFENIPVYDEKTESTIRGIIKERKNVNELKKVGLEPTRTTLFTGPPGVGKTLAAKWIAKELDRPLFILDLSSVMSSYLGRTGTNLKHVLDYAKKSECVLLLDELDAIAKRRDDVSEIGELKRLVTVLIQQLDDWPSSGLLLSATNHAELLDPAIWRRFETIIDFPLPVQDARSQFIGNMLKDLSGVNNKWKDILSIILKGLSFSEIEKYIKSARRTAAIENVSLDKTFIEKLTAEGLDKPSLKQLASDLIESKLVSQRKAHEITGLARETIRKYQNKKVKQ